VAKERDLVAAYGQLSDAELSVVLGSALLDSALGVGPVERGRFQRFAEAWFEMKREELWRRVRASPTYRLWAASAGSGQVIEAEPLAGILAEDERDGRISAAVAVTLFRDGLRRDGRTYDVAVSAADGESTYVTRVVLAARETGLVVFHEKDMTIEWWGKNFILERRRVYGQLAWHFVPFISGAYLADAQDAFHTALAAAAERGDDYILPVLIGDVRVPPELLGPHIRHLRAEDHTPAQLARALSAKVTDSKARGHGPRDFGEAVRG
jgi:hypothetical protein